MRERFVNVAKVGSRIPGRVVAQRGAYTAGQRVLAACRTPAQIDEIVTRSGVALAVVRAELVRLVDEQLITLSVMGDVVLYEVLK